MRTARSRRLLHPRVNEWHGARSPESWATVARLTLDYRLRVPELRAGFDILRTVLRTRRFMCTMPRSGSNFLCCVLNSAVAIRDGGTGEYRYVEDAAPSGAGLWIHDEVFLNYSALPRNFAFQLDRWYRKPTHPDVFLFSHYPLSKTVVTPEQMRPIFTVRSPIPQLASWCRQAGYGANEQQSFVDHGFAEQSANHLRYWADFKRGRQGEDDYLQIRYEDLVQDPSAQVARVTEFWQLGLRSEHIERAVELANRDLMLAKSSMNPDNQRISRTPGRSSFFAKPVLEHLLERFDAPLCQSFGYESSATDT